MAHGKSHGLGIGNGSIIEYPDGYIEYRQMGKLLPAFRVRLADITGVTTRKVTRDDRKRLDATSLNQVVTIQGSGTTLAEVAVNYGTGEKIEAWIREHQPVVGAPRLAAGSPLPPPMVPATATTPMPMPAPSSMPSVADELIKLAGLRDAGVLTQAEFEAQKAKLLG